MHRLDNHINDISQRIKDICRNTASAPGTSLQEALSAYAWVLLDSWVAWRTLRFILKDVEIDEKVQTKWFQTPSSYTGSQIKAIWNFSDAIVNYIEGTTGKNFKELFDGTIQKNRNSIAHATNNTDIKGSDYLTIDMYFQHLNEAFLHAECSSFIRIVCMKLQLEGYRDCLISYSDGYSVEGTNMLGEVSRFIRDKKFTLSCCKPADSNYYISFSEEGCVAGISGKPAVVVANAEQAKYDFWSNKGYYRNVDLFIETVRACWNESKSAIIDEF